jgi:hypothetical protein
MNKIGLALSLLLALAGPASAQQAGQFGAGVILGRPVGATVKYWLTGTQALDVGLGFGGDLTVYADYLWHAWDLFPQPPKGKLGGYIGLGPRFEADGDGEFAARTMAGLDYWVPNHPIELFLEGGPVFRLSPDRAVEADAGIGVRFYFSAGK